MSSNSFTIIFYMLFPALYLACSYFDESKPEIQAFPSKVVKKGGSVTIRCSSPYYEGQFRLQEETAYFDSKHDVREENFTLTNVQEYNSINYYCSQYSCGTWSKKSDFLTLKVIDPIKPQISYHLDDSENKQLLIICTAPKPPEECRVKSFFLYSGKVEIKDLKAMGSPKVTFTVSNLTAEYKCSYVLEVKDPPLHLIKSPRSNKITPTIPEDKKRTESTEGDEKEIIDTKREHVDDLESKRSPEYLIPVVATVCGCLALILILIIVVYIRRKNKSSPQKMKHSEFPQSGEADIAAEVTYCAVDENRIRATPQVEVDMKDTTMKDYNDDGITYAELNKISLTQNTQSYTPTDTSLYAEVKKKLPQ
ncbi:uncharacterized protein LOC121001602 [Bufo bufo]|uniref:uncharacterized protein LOC121001602 n=1 Tax=Bufo bufo TaxID=8384 RepID=UPI001ABE818B|nr:uncharacterized protein LOC121001602 [Bufo bufo]